MAIENSVSNYFWSTFVDSINVFDCRLSGVLLFNLITKEVDTKEVDSGVVQIT